MHTVEINIRAFCTDFTIKVKRKIPMTIQEAQIYVTRTLEWDTAVVTSIKQNGKILKNKKKEFAVTA